MVDGGSRRRGQRRRLLAAGLVILAGLAGTAAWLARPPLLFGPPLPEPNGHDTLLAAGRLVRGVVPAQGRPDRATDAELREFVAANDRAVAAARPGLAQESVVPLARLDSLAPHLDESGAFRQLSRVLWCRAELARREGRPADVLQAALDLLRLAHAVEHGGLFIDQAIGTAFRRLAVGILAGPLPPRLTADDARRAIAALEDADQGREPIPVVADRDLAFALSREGFLMRLGYALRRQAFDRLRAPALRAAEAAERQSRDQIHLLRVRLALLAYARDHPDAPRPADLRALAPAYLARIPLAPDGTRPLTRADLPPEAEDAPPPDRGGAGDSGSPRTPEESRGAVA